MADCRDEVKVPLPDDASGPSANNEFPPPYSSNFTVPQYQPQQQQAINAWPQQPTGANQYPTQPGSLQPALQNQQQQPQFVILAPPQAAAAPALTKTKKRALMICGVGNILGGLATTMVGIAILTNVGGMAIPSFITPTFCLITGTLGVLAATGGKRGVITSSLVMSIITAAICGGCFIYSCVMWGIFGSFDGSPYSESYTYMGRRVRYKTLIILFAISAVLHLFSVVLSIVMSGYGCRLTGCCRGCCYEAQDSMQGARMAYYAQPSQQGMVAGQQIMIAGQPGQQVMLAGQPGQQGVISGQQGQQAILYPSGPMNANPPNTVHPT